MSRDDDKIDKVRRDLYAVALVIILFNVAGGTLGNESHSAFVSLTFARPDVLKVAAWIAWAYFLWRYLLVAGNVFASMPIELAHGAYASPFFRRVVTRETDALLDQLHWLAGSNSLPRHQRAALKKELEELRGRGLRHSYPLPERGSFLIDVNLNRVMNFPGPEGMVVKATLIRAEGFAENDRRFLYQFPILYSVRVAAEALTIAVLVRDHFSDRVLPVLTALAAPIVALAM